MNKYKTFVLEDFVLDAGFQQWVRSPTPEVDREWRDYKAANPGQADDIRRAHLLLSGVYARFTATLSDAEIDAEISVMLQKIRQPEEEETYARSSFTSRPVFRWLGAAVVALMLASSVWYLARPNLPGASEPLTELGPAKMSTQQNQSTQKQTFVLDDGSRVELAPGAEVRIPDDFGHDKREVFLTGEAFFSVTRDVKRPFLVYSEKLVTRVLGTSFLVKAIKNGAEESVEVREGKVSVFKKEDFRNNSTGRESPGLLLTSNQKVTLEIRGNKMVKTLSAAPEIVPGKAGIIKSGYVNTPVSQVLKDLREAYQVDILFDEELLAGCPLTAILTNQPLTEKLEIICEAIEAKYEILDGQIVIYGKSCNE